ncbi:GerAB/ArcD/ProY family transporter [Paenibacillus sp. M1]|uniref:GerAB/ArcD/ProY family transporter n=1 Tax=Paenibacillus haidiansis TaxID=1574488 RepID=A0ABU7VTU1_9BACL
MAGKVFINPKELFSLMILFEFGTAIVVPIGLQADHAIWLAILAAIPGGILLYLLYNYLFRQYPDQIISGCIRKIVGPFLGWPLSLFILSYFLYNAARNLREGGDLLVSSTYDETPLFVINFITAFVMIYVLSKGVEVFFRMGQIYLFVILLTGIVGIVVLIFSGDMKISNILPLFDSWTSVLRTAYPSILLFPFGEIFCFMTVLPLLTDKQSSGKTGAAAVAISGLLLSLTHALQIIMIGSSIYTRSNFSLLAAISIVDIANFLQRLDALAILTLIICVFFKMSMYSYAVMAILADLLRISSPQKLAVPVGIVVLFMSIFSSWSFPEHVNEGKTGSLPLLLVVTVVIPLLLFIVHLAKKTIRRSVRRLKA